MMLYYSLPQKCCKIHQDYMSNHKDSTTTTNSTPKPQKPSVPPQTPPKFVPPTRPNFGGFDKNKRFPMPTIPRGVR